MYKSWYYFLGIFRYECNYFCCLYCNIDVERKIKDFFGIFDLVLIKWNEDMFLYVLNSEKWNVLIFVFYILIDFVN